MQIDPARDYAIVTGDVIASSKLGAQRRRALHAAMTGASAAVREAFAEDAPIGADIVRGDAWQLLALVPSRALRVALFYRAYLRAEMESHHFDTRMVIAVGKIDFVPDERVSEGDGPAYRLSGRALEKMARHENARFLWPDSPHEASLDVVVQLVDLLAARWSDKQALAVTGALRGWKQDRIAKSCWPSPISQQAVAQHLDRAAWSGLERALGFFETVLSEAPTAE